MASARSLAQLIAAQAQLARDELASLSDQIAQTTADLDAVNADIAALQVQADARRANPDRLQREAFRLIYLPASAIPADLSPAQGEALDELRALSNGLESEQHRLAERSTTLARLQETVAAKRADLDRSRVRAQQLAAVAATGDSDAKEADLAVLRALANDVAASQTSLAQLVASSLARTAGSAPGTWTLPVRGTITQPFGPTAFPIEPAAVYQGTYYEHFHGAIDIAAAFGMPIIAAADGVVTYVGHLPDGAEIVLVAHAGGLVSEYAHLEDTVLPPTVKVGDDVTGGEVIGYVGLTGITTGAHVHFAVMKDGLPIDPLALIAK